MLVDRLKVASDADEAFRDAVEAESGIDDVRSKVTFDEVVEDTSLQDLVSMLNLLLNTKVEFNGKGIVNSHSTAARFSQTKSNTQIFRNIKGFCHLQEGIHIPGCSNPEIEYQGEEFVEKQ